MSDEEYGKVIDEERKKLNQGYECPFPDANIYEPLEMKVETTEMTTKEIFIYESLVTPLVPEADRKHPDDENIYDEL